MRACRLVGVAVLGLAGFAGASAWAAAAGAVEAQAVTQEHRDTFDAQRLLRMGEVAHRIEDYDLAAEVYQKVVDQYPETRWARKAGQALEKIKAGVIIHLALWDPTVGGTPPGVQAAKLLRAGDMASSMRDAQTALKFYERAKNASPESKYAAIANSKIRWIRRWRNPGP